jgi:CRP-like cAMP-binding protein
MLAGQNIVDVRMAAHTAQQQGQNLPHSPSLAEASSLSTIEKVILLKQVSFFQDMTVDQLKILAGVCEEELFAEDVRIFSEGDPGGVLYVVIGGRVGIEKAGKRRASTSRLATIEAYSYFGEINLFDNSPRAMEAIALQDTLTLSLRREPLVTLARQYPDLALELINVLSQRLREIHTQIVDLARTKSTGVFQLLDRVDRASDRVDGRSYPH